MLRVSFEIAGEGQYVRGFEAMEAELQDMREPLSHIADDLKQAVGEQFASEGAHAGIPWLPLEPTYAKAKEERYGAQPILVASGQMRRAFLVDGTRELGPQRLVWGITDQTDDQGNRIAVRAGAHQTGSGVVPQRKIVALTLAERRGFDREFVSWLTHMRRRLLP